MRIAAGRDGSGAAPPRSLSGMGQSPERHPFAVGGHLDGDARNPVEVVIPVVTLQPAVGLEQAGGDAGALGGAPERVGLGRLRVAGHDQRVMIGRREPGRLAPVVDIGDGGPPGAQDGRRGRQFDAGFARPRPVLEGGARRRIGGHGAVDRNPRGLAHLCKEGILDRLFHWRGAVVAGRRLGGFRSRLRRGYVGRVRFRIAGDLGFGGIGRRVCLHLGVIVRLVADTPGVERREARWRPGERRGVHPGAQPDRRVPGRKRGLHRIGQRGLLRLRPRGWPPSPARILNHKPKPLKTIKIP